MLEISVLIGSVILGVICSKFFLRNKHNSKLLLTFSGAYFLAMTVLEILPQVYGHHEGSHSHHTIGLFVLAGVVIQYILETISKGVEHGHVHLHHNENKFPLGIFGGLFLHSLIEGIPVANAHSHDFLWAIFIHNIPVSMILFGALSQHTTSKIRQFLFMFLFAVAAPIGFVLGKFTPISNYTLEISAIVSGIFLHISTVILFEANEGHKFNAKKFAVIVVGFLLAFATVSMHIHSH
ncbi:ZIP family metal transporter [Faecalibacter macacae]|uniref:ZIP family metal transporter n=1 Tax=Faecalibacter macacae TaxID=1859289 RepID=A0A3L9MF21_9FLAO|nr:ZIP family metal transporter [Faecalibacter macacae]RLZ11498.1 ZIP family metal transporter [Faecalibacter macacae]